MFILFQNMRRTRNNNLNVESILYNFSYGISLKNEIVNMFNE